MVHAVGPDDEMLLLDLLNSTPVVRGGFLDLLAVDDEAAEWSRARGGVGSPAEVAHLRQVRDRLQAVVRGAEPATTLTPSLRGVHLLPEVADSGVSWHLDVEDDRRLATRALLAWGRVQEQMPGRLRPCANDECRLFLLDRSRPNTARWCSMKVCGNRLKVRRHYQRTQRAD
ncbi:CGNR zinc finger domain-containing protein [Pseudonocardia xinjiangensis]|uniref:CGNR zinc finger domain-containing protein n=1 Tax=Pseudonocardia xinjiangensis TaxID=75289 RepID=UPI003D92D9E9